MNSNYLLICKENSENSKRLRRRFRKQHVEKTIVTTTYKTDFNSNSLQLLKEFLLSVKRNQRSFGYRNPPYLGVLTDDNTLLVRDFFLVPQLPETWDIVFLQYKLKKIDYTTPNVVWKRVEIDDTRHFLINPYSMDKILNLVNKSKDWKAFIDSIDTLNTFGIQNMFFSEPVTDSNPVSNDITTILDYNKLVNNFSNLRSKWNSQKLYTVYPSISLVCCLTDVVHFLHTLYTFLSLDYPTDKLELVVVDDTDSEKLLKKHLPSDPRIRFLNIKPKEEGASQEFNLGYKLNVALKYCKYDVIFHLFDTNIYFKQNFKNIVECYILSDKEALVSVDTINNSNVKEQKITKSDINQLQEQLVTKSDINQLQEQLVTKSDINQLQEQLVTKSDISDLGNMIYTKRFWASFNFNTANSDHCKLAYDYIKFRKELVGFIPAITWSFNTRKDDFRGTIIDIDPVTLLTDKDRESYLMTI
jgi:hypothetical protein